MGYNSAAVHPHALPGDEPGVRRPRLLLRRSLLPARGADARACCPRTTRRQRLAADRLGPERPRPSSPGDPYPFQGGTNPFADARSTATGRRAGATPAPGVRRRSRRSQLGGRSPVDDEAFRARHDLGPGGRRGGLGGVGHAERRLGAGGDRRPDRHRPEPAHAELRHRSGGESVQRDRAGQAAARDAHADAGAQGRQALPRRSPCRAATRRTRTCSSSS